LEGAGGGAVSHACVLLADARADHEIVGCAACYEDGGKGPDLERGVVRAVGDEAASRERGLVVLAASWRGGSDEDRACRSRQWHELMLCRWAAMGDGVVF
jgi:hypothetical protein